MLKVKLPNDKVNLVYSTDWHLSATAPGRRSDDYQASVLGKLDFIRELTERLHGVSLCGGDVFHVKLPKSPANSLHLLGKLIRTLRKFPTGCVYGAVGNHDLSWDRVDSLPHQPLGIVIASDAYRNLAEESVLFTNQDESVNVLVESFPYAHGELALQQLLAAKPRPAGVQYRVGILHAYGKPGAMGSMFGEPIIGYDELAELDYDFLCWGHDHSRHETETVGNVTHVNLGSLARAALDTDQTDRPVACAIMSFASDGIRYKEKEIPVKPLELAFVAADKSVEKVANSEDVQAFFAEMDEQVEGMESTDPREVLRTLCPPEEVKLFNLVSELCEL